MIIGKKPVRILLVDDGMENIQVAGTILKEQGYQLNIARNGKQALQVVEKTKPDLILLDVIMPEMDGYECCDQLKRDPETKDIPVIFLTGNTEPDAVVRGFELGAVDYIGKPFNSFELLVRIDTHLSLRHAHLELEDLTQKAARYISPHVFDAIFKGEIGSDLDTKERELTVFFSDIAGFTKLTESMGDKDLTQWLNGYCETMAGLVHKHGGTLDKFIGDAVMVFFGDPQTKGVKEDAIACTRMAIEMLQAVTELDVAIRIGINSGNALVGNFGSMQQMNYTIIGNVVNLAARLEGMCSAGSILVSQPTYELIKDDFWCEENGPVHAKGIEGDVMTYWVHG